MKVIHYIGNHSKDKPLARLGWAVTRYTQSGPYSHITHSEAIHEEYADGSVLIASSSVRDKGVRSKRIHLNQANWVVVDCPTWDVQLSVELLENTAGQGYDMRGALATRLPGKHSQDRWFCNEWVGAPYLPAPHTFGPHQFAAITLAVGKDITADFFNQRSRK